MAIVLILNGPNLDLLGRREPEVYGNATLADLELDLRKRVNDRTQLEFFQTNHEGEMIDRIHLLIDQPIDGIIINPGAWTHTSVALRDALSALETPLVEVHISNIYTRESFRHNSFISDIAVAVISGCGLLGYYFALQTLTSNEKDV